MGGLESVGIEAFDEELSYVALGHIHRAQAVGGRETVRYAGSPLPMSFSEQHYRHQVVALTIEQGQLIDWEAIPIPLHAPLQRIPAEPAPPADVLLELQMLPFADKEADRSRWPYVEVQGLTDGTGSWIPPPCGGNIGGQGGATDLDCPLLSEEERARGADHTGLFGFAEDRTVEDAAICFCGAIRRRAAGGIGNDCLTM